MFHPCFFLSHYSKNTRIERTVLSSRIAPCNIVTASQHADGFDAALQASEQSLFHNSIVFDSWNDFFVFIGVEGLYKYRIDPKSGCENLERIVPTTRREPNQQNRISRPNAVRSGIVVVLALDLSGGERMFFLQSKVVLARCSTNACCSTKCMLLAEAALRTFPAV